MTDHAKKVAEIRKLMNSDNWGFEVCETIPTDLLAAYDDMKGQRDEAKGMHSGAAEARELLGIPETADVLNAIRELKAKADTLEYTLAQHYLQGMGQLDGDGED